MSVPAWLAAEREYDDEVIGDTTLGRLFEATAERNADREAQWYKGGVYDRSLAPGVVPRAPAGEYAALTYGEMREIVRALAAGFRDVGVEPDDRVAIFADTRMEWAQVDFALLSAGAVVTTVYTQSSPRQVRYLLDDPAADAVVVENGDLLDRVLAVEDDLDLSFVVVIDDLDGHEHERTYRDRDDVLTLADVHRRGRDAFDSGAYERWLDARSPGDLAGLIYTSGTTGTPKGVRLTHRNFRSNVDQVYRRFGPRPDKAPGVPRLDTHSRSLSFLPLAHVFERTAGHFVMFAVGATVAYAESPDTIATDIQSVRPTAVTSVPRVYERIHDRMRERATASPVKERIFEWAVDVGRRYAATDDPGAGLRLRQAVADRLVFAGVREALGGNLEMLVSGGGSLSVDLARLFQAMGLPILEGYGLTETAPVVSTNPPEDTRPGTLGPPVVDVETRLDGSVVADEQRRRASGELGELLVAGPNVTDGYWNRPEETEDAFTRLDGTRYFRTGDIIERTDDGYLVFLDRLKQLLVLDTGKNVAPGPIEDRFSTTERIEQVMVVGDGEKFVGALVVPNAEALRSWARTEGIDVTDLADACGDERVREWVGEEIARVNEDLEEHERIKAFRLVPTEWMSENDLLTPSMKKRRDAIRNRFAAEYEDLYGDDS